MCAVLAAYFRYQYKMWDVKAAAARGGRDLGLAADSSNWTNRDLRRMRGSMTAAVMILCFGFLELVVSLWLGSFAVDWNFGSFLDWIRAIQPRRPIVDL